jgi:hypothetical protein
MQALNNETLYYHLENITFPHLESSVNDNYLFCPLLGNILWAGIA